MPRAPPDVAATLARWGVHRLGELARLPAAEVATRLGPAGAALVRAARGEDERPLAPSPPPADVEEAVTLEWALDTIEPLLFVLRALVERVVARSASTASAARGSAWRSSSTTASRDAGRSTWSHRRAT